MAKRCMITGKKPVKGRSYTTRGIAKKKKGIVIKITGKEKRRFQPNLISKRVWFPEQGRFLTLRLAASALRIIDKKGLSTVLREMQTQG